MPLLKIHDNDNVAVALDEVRKGAKLALGSTEVIAREDVAKGHKIALCSLRPGQNVIKYGFPVGHVTKDVQAGQWLHDHNIKSNLGNLLDYL